MARALNVNRKWNRNKNRHRESPAKMNAANRIFLLCLALLGGTYVLLIVAMLAADLLFTSPGDFIDALGSPEIRYSIRLSLISCTISALMALWVAVPLGYLLARTNFPGKAIVDTLLDVPIVLPPLVIGLSLLILFQIDVASIVEQVAGEPGAKWTRKAIAVMPITFRVPAVILAQFAVSAAFAVRTMRVTFEQLPPRAEQVARTLGCSRQQAFWWVVLPEARPGLLTAATLAWARALGEFGPILIFAGATRMRTEVLPTTVFLELSVGKIEAAIAVSLLMIAVAAVVIVLTRTFGLRGTGLI
jgi:molybdate transport system permease protein